MASAKTSGESTKLGILISDTSLYCVETVGTQPAQSFSIPIPKPEGFQLNNPILTFDAAQLALRIQEALRQRNIRPGSVYLNVPTGEIIFRSFVIPFMQPNELKGVVAFEARKYIPFPLEELLYSYQNIPITKQDKKLIRIIFVAVKKLYLESFIHTLENLRLNFVLAEPAFLGTMRALVYNNLLPQDQTIGLLEQQNDWGRVMVVDQGVPHFVREIQLKTLSPSKVETNLQDPLTRLINETKISFDYFARQESSIVLKKILYLAPPQQESSVSRVQEELKINTVYVNPKACLNSTNVPDEMEYIPAYGATLKNDLALPSDFSFSQKKSTTAAQPRAKGSSQQKINLKSVIITAIFCSVIFTMFLFLSKKMISQPLQRNSDLKNKLGESVDLSADGLKTKNMEILNKLSQLEKIDVKSNVAYFLQTIPELLPKDAWLQKLNIAYTDRAGREAASQQQQQKLADKSKKEKNLSLELTGYVYSLDTKNQISIINEFIRKMKETTEFASYFNEIVRKDVRLENIGGFDVSSFIIKCQ